MKPRWPLYWIPVIPLAGIAVTYWLARAPKLSESLMTRLLHDPLAVSVAIPSFILMSMGALPEPLHRSYC
jgi:hypothetical protein